MGWSYRTFACSDEGPEFKATYLYKSEMNDGI